MLKFQKGMSLFKKLTLVGSIASIIGLVFFFTPLSGKFEEQSISIEEGDASGNVVGNVKGGVQTNIDNSTNSIVMDIRINANEIVQKLPEDKRKLAEQVSNIAIQLAEASTQKDNSAIKDKIVDDLTNLSLVSYTVESSPFIPPKNKVQLLCDGIFKFVYHGGYSKTNDTIGYTVNNANTAIVISPGVTRSYESGGEKLEILYLEYSESEAAPILHFECIQ
jgi:hypothetical protein